MGCTAGAAVGSDRGGRRIRSADRAGQPHQRSSRATMIDKTFATAGAAVAGLFDGASVMVGGFGTAGMPDELIDAVIASNVGDLTIISNNAGNGETGVAALIKAGRVRKIICSFPRQIDSHHFDARFRAGEIDLELVPQGNLAARIQAAGAGLGAIFT